MSNRNGLLARLGILFRNASPQQLEDLTNDIIRDEAGLAPDGALFKNDLVSALNGLKAGGDLWNHEPQDGIKTGPMEGASGGGADTMSGQYSTPSAQSKLTEDYARLGAELAETRSAVKSLIGMTGDLQKAVQAADARAIRLEKGCAALSKAVIAIAKGERFPESEQDVGKDEDEIEQEIEARKPETSEEEEREDSSARKARHAANARHEAEQTNLPSLSIKGLIEAVNSRSRGGLAAPPVFSKAGNPAAMSMDAALDGLDGADAIAVASYMQRRAHVAAGAPASILAMPLSPAARAALQASGIAA